MIWLFLAFVGSVPAVEWNLQLGDRVVWVGNTLIEREQQYGYWETELARRYPGRNITFRNLGWSGDTVFGDARAGFDTPADGFRRLKDHVLALKPTVVLLGYGGNEAFEGEAGLGHFREGLKTLLDALAPAKARIILLAPPPLENLGRPLPDPGAHNVNLLRYGGVLHKEADQRGLRFVDLYHLLPKESHGTHLTDDGLHFTAYGYWRSTTAVEEGLGLKPTSWQLDISADGKSMTAKGTKLSQVATAPLLFQAIDEVLPSVSTPTLGNGFDKATASDRLLKIRNLAPGYYCLRIDDQPVASAKAEEWAQGVRLQKGPEFDQVERLRQAIIAKNRLYFYRWRPQNETYLFGFRKHEQGQNAKEIPQFDPLVAEKETEIARLVTPVPHTYTLLAIPR
jgi:lysophospholipase L1-like esterase